MREGKAIKLTLTVKRPNGATEQVVHPTLKFITPAQFDQIKKATHDAGKGDVMSYEIEREQVKQSATAIRTSSDLFYAGVQTDNTVNNAMTLNGKSN